MLTLDKIYHAAYVLRQVARKTDLIAAPALADDCELYLKTENLQVTGSFKVRGAYYKISQLTRGGEGPRHHRLQRRQPRPGCGSGRRPAAASRASSACPTARPSARWRPPRPTAPR